MIKIIILLFIFSLPNLLFSKEIAKSKILIISKEQNDFDKLATNLTEELKNNFFVTVEKIDKSISYTKFESILERNQPKLVVLIDNQMVTLAQEFYKKKPTSKILSVALMGLNFKQILKTDKNICGIAYEVSPFSLFTQFRSLKADKKLNKVLTFYRGSQFSESVKEAIRLAQLEKIELIALDVEKEKNISQFLKTTGKKEIESGNYDAVYVILDSVLLRPDLFEEFWVPVAKNSKIPFLIGTEKLVNPAFNFATFGLSPNLKDLASQATQMIESLVAGEKCQKIEDLIGVNKFLNANLASQLHIKLDENDKLDVIILN